jgi:hypothetical protein
MYKKNDLIYDATVRLEQLINLPIEMDSNRKEHDALLTIQGIQFQVEAKSEIRNSNKGMLINQLVILKNNSKRPVLVIAKYISTEAAQELKEAGVNYIDQSGNAHIRYKEFFLYVTGQKTIKLERTNQSRAFQETGVKIIFNLLSSPENLQCSYRKIAEKTGVSIGSVSNVMKELEVLNFILITNTKRVLKNKKELLDRWVIAYSDVLKPRLLRKKMRFINREEKNNWDKIPIQNIEDVCLWGGEPAGAIITRNLLPDEFLVYTNGNWQDLIQNFGLVPDENGDVEINQIFWNEKDQFREQATVPPLLVYADLITSGYERNIETAKLILENELQDIK